MKKFVCLIVVGILLSGCGSSKSVPDWTNASFNQLDNYKKSYLNGRDSIAEVYFNRAVDEIKRSGDLEILARAYLTKYAIEVAVLETFNGGEFLKIDAVAPVSQNRSFYNFLKGSFDNIDEGLLPPKYVNFLRVYRKGNVEDIANEVSSMDDPLSKLITIGLLVKKNKYNEKVLQLAINISSYNGWKKALLVYMERLKSFYEMINEPEKAANTAQRINILKK